MRINLNRMARGAGAQFRFLIILLISAVSVWTYGDSKTDYVSLGCEGCHGPANDFDVGAYTNATLKAYIADNMPRNDPTLCDEDCAGDMANYLLPVIEPPPSPPLARTNFSSNLVGISPLDAAFTGRTSSCDGKPCVYDWDFGDGTTATQTAEYPSTLPSITHTYSSIGEYKITLTVTDNIGQTDENTLYAYVTPEESFGSYVDTCKAELGFDDADIPDNLNCATGHLFAEDGGIAINDYMDYRRITDQVDLVFACRWLQNGTGVNEVTDPPFILAASIEMLMHNRDNGNTCFFRAKNHDMPVPMGGTRSGASVEIVSPTVAAGAVPGSYEAEYWDKPLELAQGLPCVDCHVAGPYIASPRIAPFLQHFGLLNDGHDTLGRELIGDHGSRGKYHAVGETLGFMNHFAAFNNDQSTCAGSCHSIGYNSIAIDLILGLPPNTGSGLFAQLLPSIDNVIEGSIPEVSVTAAGVMPANDPATGDPDTSHYTWINRDNPFSPGDEGDFETFIEAKSEFSSLLSYCEYPNLITAHTVGSNLEFHPFQLPDRVAKFNARDGLVCVNNQQDDGRCENYRVRYQCTAPSGDISWTDWYNTDSPSYGGDYENRSDHANVCTFPFGSKATGIEAEFALSNGWTYSAYGPADRLAQFDPHGLVCRNADQPDGQCSNYVVKFSSCSDAPQAYTAHIKSAWSGNLLTSTDTGNNAETRAQPFNSGWDSQDWKIEPVPGTEYVRLRNVKAGKYLNVKDNYENAPVVIYDYVAEWGSQQWIMEPAPDSADVRFKDAWTGRYLTVGDNGTYAMIKSQALNGSWPSQRWRIEKQ